ncbi:MAG TPA: energy transducer TonB [Bryobacteraceae bacterium]|nr:energy transducer TonB [Bryobacteraceae bacterium]
MRRGPCRAGLLLVAAAMLTAGIPPRRVRPFSPPVENPAARKVEIELAPPPMLRANVPDSVPKLAAVLGQRLCTIATATYEPAKASRLRRAAEKFPRVRRSPRDAGGEGFTPARPLGDVTFALPPVASVGLAESQQIDLKAWVDPSGRVTRVEILAPRDEELVTLASYAAGGWQFAPARRNDKPVASEVILHFRFGDK